MRGFYNNTEPTIFEKLLCVATYPLPLVGFIWIIFCHLTKSYPKSFVKFHAYQSIMLSIILWIFNTLMGIILAFIKIIPLIGVLVINIYDVIFRMPYVFGYSIFHFGVLVFLFYLCINAFMGKYSEIPFISDNVKRMI